jgi:hypothetical protein
VSGKVEKREVPISFTYLAEEWFEYETILSHELFEIAPEIKELLTRLAVDMAYEAQDPERDLEEDDMADAITFKGGSGLGINPLNGQEFKISFLKGVPKEAGISEETGASVCTEKTLIDQSN